MKKLFTFLCIVGFVVTAKGQSYCTPAPYDAAISCSTYRIDIALFRIVGSSGTLFDTTACTGSGYMIDSLTTCTLNAATAYTATINEGSSAYNMNCQVWIDFDDDGTFESSESVGGLNDYAYTSGGNTFSITIPYSVPSGTHRLRVAATYYAGGGSYPSMNPCMPGYYYGEARDYFITISGGSSRCTGTPSPGTVTFTSSASCAASLLILSCSGYTTGTGILLQWQSSPDGATWTNVSGAVSATYTLASPVATTYYRCMVACSYSGLSAATSSVVITPDVISGHITYSSTAPDTASLMVWLITHDTAAGTLTAVDSVITCLDSLAPYYSFTGIGTGNYLVKAQSLDWTSSTPGSSGFVPTYGASAAHWTGATTIVHTSGSVNTQDINMIYGTVPSGPGFIGGYISAGAGRGTTGDIPDVHMLVYLKNTSTNILTYTYTDATGAYSFSSLANGSYVIYPEKLNDSTVASLVITLSTATETWNGIDFKEYTTSKIIKPYTEGVPTTNLAKSFIVFPNPATGNINIKWNEIAAGDAHVVITDITGREVYNTNVSIASVSGTAQIALPAINDGIYLLKITSDAINYTEKLTIQH